MWERKNEETFLVQSLLFSINNYENLHFLRCASSRMRALTRFLQLQRTACSLNFHKTTSVQLPSCLFLLVRETQPLVEPWGRWEAQLLGEVSRSLGDSRRAPPPPSQWLAPSPLRLGLGPVTSPSICSWSAEMGDPGRSPFHRRGQGTSRLPRRYGAAASGRDLGQEEILT